LKVNSASCWFLLYGYITKHGQKNIKFGDMSANTKSSAVHIPCISPRLTVLLGLHVVYYAFFFTC